MRPGVQSSSSHLLCGLTILPEPQFHHPQDRDSSSGSLKEEGVLSGTWCDTCYAFVTMRRSQPDSKFLLTIKFLNPEPPQPACDFRLPQI